MGHKVIIRVPSILTYFDPGRPMTSGSPPMTFFSFLRKCPDVRTKTIGFDIAQFGGIVTEVFCARFFYY